MRLHTNAFRSLVLSFFSIALILHTYSADAQNKITSPETFFGFRMGTDRKLARWDKIVDYYYMLEKESNRIKVVNMGPTSDGYPFLILIISSTENLANLDRLQMINHVINNPEGIGKEKIKTYIKEGKAIIFQSMGLHSPEVGGTQMTPEFTYELLTREDDDTKRILNNVLFFMIPCFNPDGEIMITDWYRKTVGTEYEGLPMPYLYHKYCGHDNNRDGDYLNLQESKYTAKFMFIDWQPQAYIDHHQMPSYGARFFVPPYCDPIRPWADPLVWREMSWYGADIAYRLEENGFQGVLNSAQFSGWGHFGWHWITPFHNIAGMLTESARAQLATPIYVHPEQLKAWGRLFPEYDAQFSFPNPWPGGWWHLRDIVEQKKVAAWSLLDMAAKNKETVLRNAYLKAKRQTERGASGDLKALVIPANQHDYLTSVKMINTLLRSGLEIQKARLDFNLGEIHYKKGSYVISLAQPKMGLIRNLLTETHYPKNYWTMKQNGEPIIPYDLATHTMFEFMGVRVDKVLKPVDGDFILLKEIEKIEGEISPGLGKKILNGQLNNSFKAVNILIDNGVEVKRIDKPFMDYNPGDFIVEKAPMNVLRTIAMETGVDFKNMTGDPPDIHTVKRGGIGLFQRYYEGNMDEGWTRLCLENFRFPYYTLMSNEIKQGNLNKKFNVIVIPSDSPEAITGFFKKNSSYKPEEYPEEYRSGIGEKGILNIKEFVRNGGRLVVLGSSYKFAVDVFDLKIKNVVDNLKTTEFFCPGSTVKVSFNNTHPLAYGMPDEGVVLFYSSPVFEVLRGRFNENYQTVVRYKDKNLLKSGWLSGEEKIVKKPAMIKADYGKGDVILIGFRTQHRNQTDGTFKLLFNSLL